VKWEHPHSLLQGPTYDTTQPPIQHMTQDPNLSLYNKALYNKIKHITDIIFANPFAILDVKENECINMQVWWHILKPKQSRFTVSIELTVKITLDSPLIGWYTMTITDNQHSYQYVIDANRQEIKLSASTLTKDSIQAINNLYNKIDEEQEKINQEHLKLLSSDDGLNLDVKRLRMDIFA
jgi:hypothetical protein